MGIFNLEEIALKGRGRLEGNTTKLNVTGLSIDSRSLQKGNLFIALEGPTFDGHDYLDDAKARGASAFIVDRVVDSDIPYILVDNTYNFLDRLAVRMKELTGKVISLTGSNGKTTTKEIIYYLLSSEGNCHKTEGNKNNSIGVPLTLSSLHKSFDFSVVEVGTNSVGEIDRLSKLTKPNIALITNVSPSHLEGFGSIEGIAKEKGFILEHIQEDGVAVLPRDSLFFEYWKKRAGNKRIVTFGTNKVSDIVLRDTKVDVFDNSMSFYIEHRKEGFECKMKGIGEHNSTNACAALAVGLALNLDLKKLCINLKRVMLPERRLSVHKAINSSLVIDDSYNANPESMKMALDVMKNIKDRNRIFIAGQMGELGQNKELFHNQVCEHAKDRVEEFLCIGNVWKTGLKHLPKIGKLFKSQIDLFEYVSKKINKKTVIMVKGSRSTNMDFIADKLKKSEC